MFFKHSTIRLLDFSSMDERVTILLSNLSMVGYVW